MKIHNVGALLLAICLVLVCPGCSDGGADGNDDCGNTICDPGETAVTCPMDCGCGNNAIDEGEDCDDSAMGEANCISQGYAGGDLTCAANCTFNLSACHNCGDGAIDTGEDCDGDNHGGQDCASQGFAYGELGCSGLCAFDTSGCGNDPCGDGQIGDDEACDGENLGEASCLTQGFDRGELACDGNCQFDTADCEKDCGDGQAGPNEDCDGDDLDDQSCFSVGFHDGPLACKEDCTFDTSSCIYVTCDNGQLDPDEDCDADLLGQQTCAGLGFDAGDLACSDNCSFDTTACRKCGNQSEEPGEECDDGNTEPGDGCSAVCTKEMEVVVVGYSSVDGTNRRWSVKRLDVDGNLVAGWNQDNFLPNPDPSPNNIPWDAIADSSGNIFIGGNVTINAQSHVRVAKISVSNGQPTGITTYDTPGTCSAISIGPDDTVFAAGIVAGVYTVWNLSSDLSLLSTSAFPGEAGDDVLNGSAIDPYAPYGGGETAALYLCGTDTNSDLRLLRVNLSNMDSISWDHTPSLNGQPSRCGDVLIDSQHNLYAVGDRQDGTTQDFLAKRYYPDGAEDVNYIPSFTDDTGDDRALSGAIDDRDNLYLVGYGSNGTDKDWWVRKVDPQGNQDPAWAASNIYEPLTNYPTAIKIGTDGNVLVGGIHVNANQDWDWMLVKYDRAGNELWAQRFLFDSGNGGDAVEELVMVPAP